MRKIFRIILSRRKRSYFPLNIWLIYKRVLFIVITDNVIKISFCPKHVIHCSTEWNIHFTSLSFMQIFSDFSLLITLNVNCCNFDDFSSLLTAGYLLPAGYWFLEDLVLNWSQQAASHVCVCERDARGFRTLFSIILQKL